MLRNATLIFLCLCSTACGLTFDPFKSHLPLTQGDGGVSCQAYPSCDQGDEFLLGTCPSDADCYQVSLCGNTISCAHYQTATDGGVAHCEAYPSCQPGDSEVFDGACTGSDCYELSVCGYTITCQRGLDGGVSAQDAGAADAGQCDAGHHGHHDGGVGLDGGHADGGEADAGPVDGGEADAGAQDGGVAICNARVGCVPGDVQIPNGTCPAGSACYEITSCGFAVTCARGVDAGLAP